MTRDNVDAISLGSMYLKSCMTLTCSEMSKFALMKRMNVSVKFGFIDAQREKRCDLSTLKVHQRLK